MRRIIADIGITIDGFIEDIHGQLDWFAVESRLNHANQALKAFDTLFCGRGTYQKLGIPRPMDERIPEPIRTFNENLNAIRKYVISSTVRHVEGNAMVIYQNLEQEVRRIRDEEGKDIWFCGGARTLDTFVALDLVDEYRLTVYPLVLGEGKPFFGQLTNRLRLQHVDTRALESGAFCLRYLPENRLHAKRWP